MMYLGDILEDAIIYFCWSSNGADGESITLATNGTISVYKNDDTTQSTAGITPLEDFDSVTGVHNVKIDTSADAFYQTAKDYTIILSGATIDGQTVNAVLGHFSIENRNTKANVVSLNGGAQSLLDLKDFADDGYDPSTNKVQGVVLTDTLTTYTGNTPQTGDAYAIVNSGTHGNAALKTLIDTVDTVVDAIKVKTDALPSDPADASVVAGQIAAVQAVVDALATAVAALNDLSAAEVNAEMVDALATDTYAEPTGVPGATISLAAKLGWLFMALRNKLEVTATAKTFYDDGGAAEWKKTLGDDGTTYSETEGTAP